MRQDSHRGDIVHAVRQYMALLGILEPVQGEAAPWCVLLPPLRLISYPCQNGGLILPQVAQHCGRKLALVAIRHWGEEGEREADESGKAHLQWLLRRRSHTDVEIRDPLRQHGDHIYASDRGEAAARRTVA